MEYVRIGFAFEIVRLRATLSDCLRPSRDRRKAACSRETWKPFQVLSERTTLRQGYFGRLSQRFSARFLSSVILYRWAYTVTDGRATTGKRVSRIGAPANLDIQNETA